MYVLPHWRMPFMTSGFLDSRVFHSARTDSIFLFSIVFHICLSTKIHFSKRINKVWLHFFRRIIRGENIFYGEWASCHAINHLSRIGCPVVLVGCNGLYSCIQTRTTWDAPRLSLPFGSNVCRYSSETFRCRCIEATVLAAEGTEAALLDEQVEVLRGKVGGALADGLHL